MVTPGGGVGYGRVASVSYAPQSLGWGRIFKVRSRHSDQKREAQASMGDRLKVGKPKGRLPLDSLPEGVVCGPERPLVATRRSPPAVASWFHRRDCRPSP